MSMVRLLILLTIACWMLLASIPQSKTYAQTKMRAWRTAQSEYTLEAQFMEIVGDKVRLRKSDGKSITVALNQLSLRDLVYLKNYLNDPRSFDVDPDFVKAEKARLFP